MLEMVALLAMEPPVSGEPDALRDERVKVLSATKTLEPASVVTGQYAGYKDEAGVASDSSTETYFAAELEIDSWRWAGVPWLVRAGKKLASTVTEAVVEFDRPPRMFFDGHDMAPGPNRLVFQSKPDDRITLSMRAKEPGPDLVSRRVDLRGCLSAAAWRRIARRPGAIRPSRRCLRSMADRATGHRCRTRPCYL